MSKKNTKIDVKVPLYNIEEQIKFINSVASDFDILPDRLMSLICADWICNFQVLSSKQGPYKAFVTYLQTIGVTRSKLIEIKEAIENGNKSE